MRAAVEQSALPIGTAGADEARRDRVELLNQLDDYVLPRLRSLDAPLLCVVGGSTGAGKSTLVSSIVGEVVSRAGVLRPTTRASVLIHHPQDARWFADNRILPGLARLTGGVGADEDPGQLRLVASDHIPAGLALLDAPDIDSVVEANRDLARQLLSAADLWLFVTTAVRYADAVPWSLLQQATERGTSVAVVLNRVPVDAMEEVRADLAQMLMDQGLGQSPIFAVLESRLDEHGLLPYTEVSRMRSWLTSLAADAHARSTVIRRTLTGAIDSLSGRASTLADATQEQADAADGLGSTVAVAYQHAHDEVAEGMSDGSLLRGEVLARWQEFVGTGEWFRQLDAGVGKLRDKVSAILRGRGQGVPTAELGEALHTGVAALIASHGEAAALAVARQWRTRPGGAELLAADPGLAGVSTDFDSRVQRLVREWQGEVLELVRSEAGGRRTTARFLAFGVNGIAVMLMLITFSATAGLTGAEVGIAGGSAVVAQRLLEAIFGDQAVRSLSAKARRRLLDHVDDLYAHERRRYDDALRGLSVDPDSADRLRAAVNAVKDAR
ncbi:GTPase family protein [Luteipulveratus flavus]|uniref:GTPase domain-containing protein n=2 Tax=Luteipulveratus flavus TaxID=3031728 RepID=A0ABT6CBF7_9MICO|nr:GTPase domain-containing protein [Luteipulveratus sp. YIM 133296]MDF8265389.1 GTPase domain-containing protein [Luteipulveratus sp. YIM 133296]